MKTEKQLLNTILKNYKTIKIKELAKKQTKKQNAKAN